MTSPIDLEIDPGRLCFGLSRIGYTPASAICDIIDNSIRANAKNVHVLIHKDRDDLSDTRKNNVQDYVIIDDGHGMNYEQMKEALKLGSSSQNYEEHSLSKFGLGLKSAAFSQGDELHLISSAGSSFKKFVVSLPQIQSQGKYFATDVELSDVDAGIISRYLTNSKGTIIRIANIRKINHPSVKKTLDELKYKTGVIYYYFIIDGVKISLEDEVIQKFDVLFSSEADQNGNLDEHTWDAKTVKWIERTREVVLDADNDVRATIEVTQLPYPPIFNLEQQGKAADIREKYRIGAGNYGYYVYRNKRLISWAEGFESIIPQSIDYYAFRGRILIDDTADDCFNIDVKKSTLTLSDDAWRAISDFSDQYKRKSRKAWEKAYSLLKHIEGSDPNTVSNDLASSYSPPDSLPGEPLPTPESERERKKREDELIEEMKSKLKSICLIPRS